MVYRLLLKYWVAIARFKHANYFKHSLGGSRSRHISLVLFLALGTSIQNAFSKLRPTAGTTGLLSETCAAHHAIQSMLLFFLFHRKFEGAHSSLGVACK